MALQIERARSSKQFLKLTEIIRDSISVVRYKHHRKNKLCFQRQPREKYSIGESNKIHRILKNNFNQRSQRFLRQKPKIL